MSFKLHSCLLHPKKKAEMWTGHVHCFIDQVGEFQIAAGWCKDCRMNEVSTYANEQSVCGGCFGDIGGLR